MDFDPKISLFKSARTNTPYTGEPSVSSMLDFIRIGTYKAVVEAVRSAPDKETRTELKKKLHAVTWSGTFSKRNMEGLLEYSGIICHDIDNLDPDQLQAARAALVKSPYLLSCFISPSGNGLKLLFLSDHLSDSHSEAWQAIDNYLRKNYKLQPDPACKDICRLCFVSYDPSLYSNPNAEPVNIYAKEFKITPPDKPTPTPPIQAPTTTDYTAKCHEIVSKTVQPVNGSYNAYINQFAIQANRYGLDQEDCARAVAYYCGFPAPDKEDKATIKSVYSKFSAERGKYLENKTPRSGSKVKIKARVVEKGASGYDESVLFWYIVGKVNKETGEVITDNNGNPLGEYKFSYDDAIQFLQNNGFYKYRSGEGYQFIHIDKVNNHVDIVNELRIKEFMIDFLKNSDSLEYKRVREMFRRGAKNYCSANILEGLEYYNPEIKRDTSDTAFVYFKNCFLEITKDGIHSLPYTSQKGFIWRRQMLDVQFRDIDYAESDVCRFIWYACTGRKAEINERTEDEIKKYNSICTTIGYILHRYKSPILTKAVIAVDAKLRITGENNGRSGKSLFIKLISRMLNVVTIDGKTFGFDKDFNFQKVNIDTDIINFDDVKDNFDFSRLFSMITEEFSFEKKRIDLITLPFADAPKFFISSNKTLKGSGASFIARQQIIEFSTYFNPIHTPAKEFGRMFFFDWDCVEWNRYYSFMVHCIRMYLSHGLIDFPLENYGLNKLIDTAGEDFVDYMDETVKAQLRYVTEFDSQKLYDAWLEGAKPKYAPKKNTFSKWVRMWAALNDLDINAHKNGERDRRNGVDYLVFTEKYPNPDAAPDPDNEKLPF